MNDLNTPDRPKVGVGVIVIRDGKILLGERLASHGAGTYQLPGGHLEFGESFEEAAKREVEEEAGLLDIEIQGVVSLGNYIDYGKHYVSIGLLAESHAGEPYDAEPAKSKNWNWYDFDHLPSPLFPHSKSVIDNWRTGKIY